MVSVIGVSPVLFFVAVVSAGTSALILGASGTMFSEAVSSGMVSFGKALGTSWSLPDFVSERLLVCSSFSFSSAALLASLASLLAFRFVAPVPLDLRLLVDAI
jgi:hypothetical protein